MRKTGQQFGFTGEDVGDQNGRIKGAMMERGECFRSFDEMKKVER